MTAKDEFEKGAPVNVSNGERITRYWPAKAEERKEGDTVVGKYVGSVTFKAGTPDEATLYKLVEGDEVIGVNASAVIRDAFETMPVNTRVGVRYNGKKMGKNGRQYNSFEVRILADTATTKSPEPSQEIDLTDIPFGND